MSDGNDPHVTAATATTTATATAVEATLAAFPAHPGPVRRLAALLDGDGVLPASILLHDPSTPEHTAALAARLLSHLAPALHCVSVSPLTTHLSDLSQLRLAPLLAHPTRRLVVLVRNAERARDRWPEPLTDALSRLPELTAAHGRICTLWVSPLPWSHFRTPAATSTSHPPILIHLPRPPKHHMLTILARDSQPLLASYRSSAPAAHLHATHPQAQVEPEPEADENSLRRLHTAFLDLFYDAAKNSVRDYTELRTLAAAVWHVFIVPVQTGELGVDSVPRLLLLAAPVFRDALARLFTRQIAPVEWAAEARAAAIHASRDRIAANPPAAAAVHTSEETKIDQEDWLARDVARLARMRLSASLASAATLPSLPPIPTFLLLASFLASYNPTVLDVRYFLRDRGPRIRARKPKTKTSTRISSIRQQLLGPRPFPLDRLIAIFQALVTEALPHSNWELRARSRAVYNQINTLVARRMLIRTTPPDRIASAVNLRTNVSHSLVSSLARRVRFDLGLWLYDWGSSAGTAGFA